LNCSLIYHYVLKFVFWFKSSIVLYMKDMQLVVAFFAQHFLSSRFWYKILTVCSKKIFFFRYFFPNIILSYLLQLPAIVIWWYIHVSYIHYDFLGMCVHLVKTQVHCGILDLSCMWYKLISQLYKNGVGSYWHCTVSPGSRC
jgi:hypothetical protein